MASGSTRHSYQPSIGTRQRLLLTALRNAGDVATLSARALISGGPLASGAPPGPALIHDGISPQRMSRTRRVGSSSGSLWRDTTVAIVSVGATL
ncbi:Uncharacterised protein [Mycobacterium tuberculosis]|uniref:Uncharacterized protein n=1 Tax=Mycobacterium tuberculosis TaxID=1773 RepID=A0A655G0G0_MYCTX|nr:Uncharacterised protein [Mycobacterium tuberculosis]